MLDLVKPIKSKYILSSIDNKKYCKSNGQFARHLSDNKISEEEYVSKFKGLKIPYCESCGNKFKFLSSTWEWSKHCKIKKCKENGINLHWKNVSVDDRKQHGTKSMQWLSDPEKVTTHKLNSDSGNRKVGIDGLTGYERTKYKREQTLLEKTGHKYVVNTWGKISESRKKEHALNVKKGMFRIYGVENASQHPDIKAKIKKTNNTIEQKARRSAAATALNARIRSDPKWEQEIAEKRSKTMFERYGTENPLCLAGKISKISLSLFDGIFNILNEGQYHSNGGELRIGQSFVDFAYRDKVIEFNGDYWHANPKKYKADFIVKISKKIAKDIWARDEERIKKIIDNGYKVKIVWENDFRSDRNAMIEECVQWLKS